MFSIIYQIFNVIVCQFNFIIVKIINITNFYYYEFVSGIFLLFSHGVSEMRAGICCGLGS